MVWSFSHSLLFLTFFSWFLIKVRVNSSRQFHVQNSLTHFIVSQRELLLTRFLFKVRLLYQAPNMQYSIVIQFKFLFWDYLLKRLKSFFKRLCPHHDSLYFSLLPPFERCFCSLFWFSWFISFLHSTPQSSYILPVFNLILTPSKL